MVCVGVKESFSEVLDYLNQKSITIGTVITVEGREPFDGSMAIRVDGKAMFISEKIANNLYVQSN